MIETLIAASTAVTTLVTVSCTDINTLVDRAKVYSDISDKDRQEIIDLYYDFADMICTCFIYVPQITLAVGVLAVLVKLSLIHI